MLDRFAREHRGAPASSGGAPAAADETPDRAAKRRERSALRERWDALRRRPGFGLAFAGAAAMAGAVVLAIGVIATTGDDGGGTQPQVAQQKPDFESELASVSTGSAASGKATLFREQTGMVVQLDVSGLKTGPAGPYSFELWCVGKNGWRISAGTFRVDRNGDASVRLSAAADPAKYDTLSIESADPKSGGKPGERVMVGKLHS